MLLIALALTLTHGVGASSQSARLQFETVAVDAGGVYTTPFSESENHYALVMAQDPEPGSTSMPLGGVNDFSPFQSSQSLVLAPGEYDIVERGASDASLRAPGVEGPRLLTVHIRSGDWITLSCSAHGTPHCTAERLRGVQRYQ